MYNFSIGIVATQQQAPCPGLVGQGGDYNEGAGAASSLSSGRD